MDTQLTTADSRELANIAKAVRKASDAHVKSAFEIAEHLDRAHEVLAKHGNGTFGAWVEAECGISRRTAENYRRLLTLGDGVRERLSQTCTLEALYMLARDKTSEDVIEAVVEKAEAGERITAKAVKAIAELVMPQPEPQPEPEPEVEEETKEEEEAGPDHFPDAEEMVSQPGRNYYTTDGAISDGLYALAMAIAERYQVKGGSGFERLADALDAATTAWNAWRTE